MRQKVFWAFRKRSARAMGKDSMSFSDIPIDSDSQSSCFDFLVQHALDMCLSLEGQGADIEATDIIELSIPRHLQDALGLKSDKVQIPLTVRNNGLYACAEPPKAANNCPWLAFFCGALIGMAAIRTRRILNLGLILSDEEALAVNPEEAGKSALDAVAPEVAELFKTVRQASGISAEAVFTVSAAIPKEYLRLFPGLEAPDFELDIGVIEGGMTVAADPPDALACEPRALFFAGMFLASLTARHAGTSSLVISCDAVDGFVVVVPHAFSQLDTGAVLEFQEVEVSRDDRGRDAGAAEEGDDADSAEYE